MLHIKKKTLIIVALILAVLLFLAGAYLVINNYRNLRRSGVFRQPQYHLRSLRNLYRTPQGHASIAEVDLIRTWMTFNYINKAFNLPADYLKTNLGVTDGKYPNVTIAKSAQEQKESENTYLEKLQAAVRQYLSQNNPQQ